MSIQKKVKFAIVGYGHIGKKHGQLITNHSNAELVAVVDPLLDISIQGDVSYYTNIADLLYQHSDLDVINICSPNGFHAEQAIACLKTGKNVVIEKPIALSYLDAQLIKNAAIEQGKYVFPVVQNRYSTNVRWLKDIVSRNSLGDIFTVQLNCFWNRDDRYYTKGGWHGTLALDGGPLYTQFSHFIDVLLWIFGDIKTTYTRFSNYNHQNTTEFEDSGTILFDLINGGNGNINYSTSIFKSNFESSITVIAEKGTIKIGGQYMNSIDYCNAESIELPSLTEMPIENNYGLYQGSAANHHHLIDNVINVINGMDEQHVALIDGLRVVDAIEKIYAFRNMPNQKFYNRMNNLVNS